MIILARIALVCRIRKIRSSKNGMSSIKYLEPYVRPLRKKGSRTAMCNILTRSRTAVNVKCDLIFLF